MADTITPNLALIKPEIGASADSWGNKLNGNFDILDLKSVRQTIQWTLVLGDDNPASGAGAFLIERWNNAGVKSGTPVTINRQTGDVALANNLTVNGSIFTNAFSSSSLTTNGGPITAGAITATTLNATTSITTPTYGGTNMALGGAISSNTVTANAITSNGALTVAGGIAANGALTTNSNVTINSAGSFGVGGNNRVMIQQAGDPTISFHSVGAFGTHFGMSSNGNFYMGGWSHSGVTYQFWTSRDFNYVPPSTATVDAKDNVLISDYVNRDTNLFNDYVARISTAENNRANGDTSLFNDYNNKLNDKISDGRLEYAGDHFRTQGSGMNEPIGGAVVTGLDIQAPTPHYQLRLRRMQLYKPNTGWFTVGAP